MRIFLCPDLFTVESNGHIKPTVEAVVVEENEVDPDSEDDDRQGLHHLLDVYLLLRYLVPEELLIF